MVYYYLNILESEIFVSLNYESTKIYVFIHSFTSFALCNHQFSVKKMFYKFFKNYINVKKSFDEFIDFLFISIYNRNLTFVNIILL